MKNKINYTCECAECKGSGVYVGFAERDGMAVVCSKCKGTGRKDITIEYEPFTGRKKAEGVTRVLQTNPGIQIGGDLERFGGMTYESWRTGIPFSTGMEMRNFTCPAWWAQSANAERPDWNECRKNLGNSFSQCRCFSNKAGCWERYDNEQCSKNTIVE